MTETSITVGESLHNSCRAVWVCKRCGNCARHCKHDDPANFHEDLILPCSGPCQCIDCVPIDEPVDRELFRIKPLEWRPSFGAKDEGRFAQSPIRNSYYQVYKTTEGGWAWFLSTDPTNAYHPCDSLEEGEQLAEQHWREYVTQALVPVETNE